MKIHHYSERGLVNAWVQAIASKGDDSLLLAFLDKAFLVGTSIRLNGSLLNLGRPLEIDLYVEPSLSEFGNPDVVILIKGTKGGCAAIYVEAKLCPFFVSAPKINDENEGMYRKNSSRILHELYMKASLHQELQTKKDTKGLAVKVYIDEPNHRKLGTDPQVIDLAKRLAECEPYFLALTTDHSREASETRAIRGEDSLYDQIESQWLLWKKDVVKHLKKMESLNHPPAKTGKGIDWTKPLTIEPVVAGVRERWHAAVAHLSWFDVWCTAKENQQKELVDAITENHNKFKFPSLPDSPEFEKELEKLWAMHGLDYGKERKSERRTLYSIQGSRRAFATFKTVQGFYGPALEFYFPHRNRKKSPETTMILSWKVLGTSLTTGNRCLNLDRVLKEFLEK